MRYCSSYCRLPGVPARQFTNLCHVVFGSGPRQLVFIMVSRHDTCLSCNPYRRRQAVRPVWVSSPPLSLLMSRVPRGRFPQCHSLPWGKNQVNCQRQTQGPRSLHRTPCASGAVSDFNCVGEGQKASSFCCLYFIGLRPTTTFSLLLLHHYTQGIALPLLQPQGLHIVIIVYSKQFW